MAWRKILFWGVLGILFWLAGVSVAIAQEAGAISETAFWELVDRTVTALAKEEEQMPALLSLSNEWATIDRVLLADGSQLAVDGSYLAKRLQTEDLDAQQLQAELQAWLIANQLWSPPEFSAQAGKDAHQQLAEILSQPAFQWESEEPLPPKSWVDRLLDHFFTFLERVWPGQKTAFTLGQGVATIAGIFLIIVLVYIVRHLLQDVVGEARLPQRKAADDPLTAQDAHQQAQNAAGTGDYRTAVRYLYLACLLSLDERGLLRYDRSLTNREYLRTISHLPDLAKLLGEVVELFDRVWYGFQSISETTYRQYELRVQALQQEK